MKEKNKYITASGVSWRFAEKWGCQTVSFIVTIVIARIIDPAAYGIVAIVNASMQIFSVFIDTGLGSSLIQKKDANDLDYSTVLTSNIVVCSFVYLLLFLFAPLIAKYYEIESLTSLIRVAGLIIVISSVKNVQEAYISKNLLFKKFFFSSLAGTVGAAIVGIAMALKGYGVWALVVSNLFDVIVDTIVMLFSIKWKPKIGFSKDRFKSLFNYGWKILVSRFIDRLYNKMYHLVIGKFYTSESLAYYDKGNGLTSKIADNTDSVINSVLFPILSKKQDDKEELKRVSKRTLQLNTYIIFPLLVGMLAVSKTMVIFLLTEKWLLAVPYIQLFCLINLFLPIHTLNANIIKAVGKSDIILKQEIVKKVVGVILLLITLRYGPLMIVLGKLMLNIIYMFINSAPNKKLIEYGLLEQIKDILPNIIISVIMGIIIYMMKDFNITNSLLLFLQIIFGIIIYIFMSIISKNESYNYLLKITKNKIGVKENEIL